MQVGIWEEKVGLGEVTNNVTCEQSCAHAGPSQDRHQDRVRSARDLLGGHLGKTGREDAGAGTDLTPVMKGGGEHGQEEPQTLVQL